jgi:hypothetical protein
MVYPAPHICAAGFCHMRKTRWLNRLYGLTEEEIEIVENSAK